jgi:hypothetical protein
MPAPVSSPPIVVALVRAIGERGPWAFGAFVFVVLVLALETGFHIGRTRAETAASLEKDTAGVSTVTAGMLAFVVFTLALTTGIAENRFEARRQATLVEANAIGTAWQRTALAGAAGKPVAGLIAEYAQARLAYLAANTPESAATAAAKSDALAATIWRQSLPVLAGMPPLAATLASALGDMSSAGLSQRYATESRTPAETLLGLVVASMLAASALGYQSGLASRRQLVLSLLLVLMVSGAMMMIVDFNTPQGGFIQVSPAPLLWTISGFVAASQH